MTNAPQTTEEAPEGEPTIATVGAILAVDIGSLYTRGAMFDVVGGEYRFVARASAPSTAEPPYGDITSGVYNVVRDLEEMTGRKLTDDTRLRMPQRGDGSGIDLFIATSSAAPALRLVVAAVSQDISAASALQVARSTYTQVVSRITLDEGVKEVAVEDDVLNSTATAWVQDETDKLLSLPPDVVLMAGGVDNGPVSPLVRLAKVVAGAAREQAGRAERAGRVGKSAPGLPMVIFAGNASAVEAVHEALAPINEMEVVANIRPDLRTEQLGPAEATLNRIYRDRRVPQVPGYATLARWIEGTIAPTIEAERLVARFLYSYYRRETLLVDVGATSTSLFLANSEADQAVVFGDLGLAYGLGNLLAERGTGRVQRWLPFPISEGELTDWALNKIIRPLSLPQTARDLAIEQAFAREALVVGQDDLLAYNAGRVPRCDLIIGTGGLMAHSPRPGQVALMLLDALQPTAESLGSVELAVDNTLLIPALGNLAQHNLAAASYIFDRDCLIWLGTAIVVCGGPESPVDPKGTPPIAVSVTVERQPGGTETMDVPYGAVQVVTLRPEQRAALTLKPGPSFRIGGGEPGKPLKTEPGQEVKGGLVGLIIDARGRPISLPDEPTSRAVTIRRWWASLDAIPTGETYQIEVPAREEPDTEGVEQEAPSGQ